MRLRLATFNVENLFKRLNFSAFTDERSQRYLPEILKFAGEELDGDFSKFEEFKSELKSVVLSQEDDKRQHTALSFAAADADIYGLQEVDDFKALEGFMDNYVKKIGVDPYHHIVLHEGNDRRGIDVAAVTRDRMPVMTRSHAMMTGAKIDDTETGKALLNKYPKAAKEAKKLSRKRIFRRDCLELETRVEDKEIPVVTVFVCHFKSMGGGREDSIGIRQLEAIAVREIINRKFKDPSKALWAVVGDLNDYRMQISVSKVSGSNGKYSETIKVMPASKPSGIDPLIDDFGFNTLELLPEKDRWTHYYPSGRHKTQLDYIIVSPALKKCIKGKPEVIREGMPYRVPNSEDISRYPRIGWDRPKASDHCPVVIEFNIKKDS